MQTPDITKAAVPTIAETLAKLAADEKTGLTDAEVQERLKKYGPNALVEKEQSAFTELLGYFWGPIPWMIEAAALMAFVVGDWGTSRLSLHCCCSTPCWASGRNMKLPMRSKR